MHCRTVCLQHTTSRGQWYTHTHTHQTFFWHSDLALAPHFLFMFVVLLSFWPFVFLRYKVNGTTTEREQNACILHQSFDDVFSDVVCHFECRIVIKIGLEVSAHTHTHHTKIDGIFGNLLNYLATCTCWPFFLFRFSLSLSLSRPLSACVCMQVLAQILSLCAGQFLCYGHTIVLAALFCNILFNVKLIFKIIELTEWIRWFFDLISKWPKILLITEARKLNGIFNWNGRMNERTNDK